jgi:8-oxo-dGTP pyrophosphatase MutT (NUDIX family)
MSDSPFKLTNTREVYRNPWIAVREDSVIRPGGKPGIFGVVTMKPGSSVLPVTDDGQVYLTREYKYAIGRESLEVASGAMDGNESPLACAQRELEEEMGLVAEEWIDAGCVDPFTTVVSSPNYLFICRGLKATQTSLDEGEVLSVVKMPLAETYQKVMHGEITHAGSCVLILKAAQLLHLIK